MGWTKSDIEKIKNRIISYEGEPVIRRKSNSKGKKDSAAILHIKRILQEYNLIYTAEKKFKHSRNYRLDFAIESEKIAIEYEGIISDKSRHTTIKGYSNDTEKYNAATSKGWKVFRYTILNYTNIELDLLRYFFWGK